MKSLLFVAFAYVLDVFLQPVGGEQLPATITQVVTLFAQRSPVLDVRTVQVDFPRHPIRERPFAVLARVRRRTLVKFVDVAFHRGQGFAFIVALAAPDAISNFRELFAGDGQVLELNFG